MDTLDLEIQTAAKKRARAEKAFNDADAELRALLVKGRAEGKGPSHMAKLTGFTREWVAKIAPDPKAVARRAVDPAAAHHRGPARNRSKPESD